jgi:hypothetical protein
MIWMPGSHTDDVYYVQVLSADWDKYSEFTVFSGGVDRCIRAWDLRRPDLPIMAMYGHGYVPAPVIFNQSIPALFPHESSQANPGSFAYHDSLLFSIGYHQKLELFSLSTLCPRFFPIYVCTGMRCADLRRRLTSPAWWPPFRMI